MRECRTSGFVRGALSNARPYRDYKLTTTGIAWRIRSSIDDLRLPLAL
jgi:hypothetical protein